MQCESVPCGPFVTTLFRTRQEFTPGATTLESFASQHLAYSQSNSAGLGAGVLHANQINYSLECVPGAQPALCAQVHSQALPRPLCGRAQQASPTAGHSLACHAHKGRHVLPRAKTLPR